MAPKPPAWKSSQWPTAAARATGGSVSTDTSVSPQILVPRAQALPIERPIYRQNAVQVVDLMLQQLREPTVCLHPFHFPSLVPEANPHPHGPLQPHQQAGEREAIVPELELLLALPFVLGIPQAVRAALQFDVY